MNDRDLSSDDKLTKSKFQKKTFSLTIILILIIVGLSGFFIFHAKRSAVPAYITKQVSFPIFIPDSKLLPPGYSLDKNSFSVQRHEAVIYTVSYPQNQRLNFSVQQKPSNDDLALFNKNYIPIHRQVLTLIGTATEGAIGNQTVVSLPTNDGSWVLITGPQNIYGTDDLARVLNAIRENK